MQKDIIKYLNKQGLSANEIQETYERYIWNIEKCKELVEKDISKQVIRTETSSPACPICKHNVNNRYCGYCGQKLKY